MLILVANINNFVWNKIINNLPNKLFFFFTFTSHNYEKQS